MSRTFWTFVGNSHDSCKAISVSYSSIMSLFSCGVHVVLSLGFDGFRFPQYIGKMCSLNRLPTMCIISGPMSQHRSNKGK